MFHIGLGTHQQLVQSRNQEMLQDAANAREEHRSRKPHGGFLSRLFGKKSSRPQDSDVARDDVGRRPLTGRVNPA